MRKVIYNMTLFYEKAFWGFLALVSAFVVVIYRMFNSGIDKDFKIKKTEIKEELKAHFEKEFIDEIKSLEKKVEEVRAELKLFKNNENNHYKVQIDLTKKLLNKLDILHKVDPKILAKILESDE